MKRALLLMALLAGLCAGLQAQAYTSVTGSNLTDLNGNKLAQGTICFLGTDQADQPVNFGLSGGGQVLRRPSCFTVTNGVIATGAQIPNPATTSPTGILYRITVTDTQTKQVVLVYNRVSLQGSSWDFDTYQPYGIPVPPPPNPASVTGPLNVSGDVNVTGTSTLGVTTAASITAKNLEQIRYADQFATGGSGTIGSPWTGWQTAITSAGSGGKVAFPAGYYSYNGDLDITQPVTFDIRSGAMLTIAEATSGTCDAGITSCGDIHIDHTSNVKIICENPNTSVIEPMISDGNGAYSTLWIDNSSYVEVVGCKILQGNVTGRTNVYGAVRVLDSNHVRLISNHIAASAGVGIHAIQMADGAISDNFIDGTQADGIHLSRASTRVTVSDNVIENTGDDGIGLVGYLNSPTDYAPVSDITVVGNILLNNGRAPAGRGIACDGCARTRIAHNIVVNPQLACILVAGEPDSSGTGVATRFPFGVSVEDNSLYGCGQDHTGGTLDGVYATSVRDVRVTGNFIQSPYGNGITLNTAGIYAVIAGNQIEQPGQRGISIQPTTQTSTANGRLITELWTNFGDGTPSSVGWSHIDLRNNSISAPGLEGIYPQWDGTTKITQLTIDGNDIKGVASSYGPINANGVDGVAIAENTITGTAYGIEVYNTTGGLIADNRMSQIGSGGGILSLSSSNLLIVRNMPGNGIFSNSTSSGNFIAFNDMVGNGTITVQSGSARLLLNPGDTTIDNFPNGVSSTTGAFSGAVALNGGGSIASGKILLNNGTISGGTINAITLQQGGAAIALASQLPLSATLSAWSPGAIAAGVCVTTTQAVANATTSMSVGVSPAADPGAGLTWEGWVSAAGAVSVRLCNTTAASITPNAESYNIRVIQ